MKYLVFLIFSLFLFQSSFAQTKLGESKSFDDGSTEVRKLIETLKKATEDSGLIIIHSNKTREMLGNIISFMEGVKSEVKFKLGEEAINRVSFVIVNGKDNLFKEFWIVPRNKKKQNVKEIEINLNKLKTKYIYASLCSDCVSYAPVISAEREDFKPFANVLKVNSKYKGLIVAHSHNRNWGIDIKNDLIREFDIDCNQIELEFEEPFDFPHPVFYFYIIPNTQKVNKNN